MYLNNRELAILAWSFILLLVLLRKPKFRSIVSKFTKQIYCILTSKVMLKVNAALTAYVILIIYILFKAGIYDSTQLKNSIIWFFSIALIPLFSLESFSKNSNAYKVYCFSSLKILAIIQYLVGIYVFDFTVEFILAPIVFAFAMLYAFFEYKELVEPIEQKIKSFLLSILSLYGLALIIFTIYMAVIDYDEFSSWHNLQDFLVPILMTIMYLPFVFLLVAYSCYERAFISINFKFKEHGLKNFTKRYVVYKFKFNYDLLRRWQASLMLHSIESKKEVKQSVLEIINLANFEKNPPPVATNKGWSPYDAMKFLSKFGIKADNYHHLYDDEWWASTNYKDTSEDFKSNNNVIYYVKGNQHIANSLKIYLNMSWVDTVDAGHNQLLTYASELISNSLDRDIKPEIEKAILEGDNSEFTIGRYQIVFLKEPWGNKQLNGYNLSFEIKLIDLRENKSGIN